MRPRSLLAAAFVLAAGCTSNLEPPSAGGGPPALEEIGEGEGFDFDALDLSLEDEPPLDADGEAAGLEPPVDEE